MSNLRGGDTIGGYPIPGMLGTNGKIAKFNGPLITDSLISDDGTIVSINGRTGINTTPGPVNSGTNVTQYYLDINGSLRIRTGTTQTDLWPVISWGRDEGGSIWDEGLMRGGTTRHINGKAGFGIHFQSDKAFSFFSTGWYRNWTIEHGGHVNQTGNLVVNGTVYSQNTRTIIGAGAQNIDRISIGSNVIGAEYSTGALEVREVNYVANTQLGYTYAPSIGFHWGMVNAATIAMHADGQFHFRAQAYNGTNSYYRNIHANDFYARGFQGLNTGNTPVVESGLHNVTFSYDANGCLSTETWRLKSNGIKTFDKQVTMTVSTGGVYKPSRIIFTWYNTDGSFFRSVTNDYSYDAGGRIYSISGS